MIAKLIRVGTVFVIIIVLLLASLPVTPVGAAPIISNLSVADIRDSGFVVSWTTDVATNGVITLGLSKPPTSTVTDSVSSTTTHFIRLSGLIPSATYYFQVSSGGSVDNNSGAYYSVTLGPILSLPPLGNLIWGYVYQSGGTTIVPNAIVFLQLQDMNGLGSPGSSQIISIRADTTGVYSYNFGIIRTNDLQAYYSYTPGVDNLQIICQGGISGTRGVNPPPWIITSPAATYAQQNIILSEVPTAVDLVSFVGVDLPNAIKLDWTTASEMNLVGFNVYRAELASGPKTKLNSSMIHAQKPGQIEGAQYHFIDGVSQGRSYYYWLEAVNLGGTKDYGPLSLTSLYYVNIPVLFK